MISSQGKIAELMRREERWGSDVTELLAVLQGRCCFSSLIVSLKGSQDVGTIKEMLFSCALGAVSFSSHQDGELGN